MTFLDIRHVPSTLRTYLQRIQASPLGYGLARGAFWSLTSAVALKVFSLLASIFVARFLGKELFGAFAVVQSTISMFAVLAGFGLGMASIKHIAEFRIQQSAVAGRVIGAIQLLVLFTSGLTTLILVLMSDWLSQHVFSAPELGPILRICSPALFFGAVNGTQIGSLSGLEAFRALARVNLVVGLGEFVALVGGAFLGGLEGAAWGLVASGALSFFAYRWTLVHEAKRAAIVIDYADCAAEWKRLAGFCVPALFAGALGPSAYWACNAILANEPGGYAEIGAYSAAARWLLVVLFIPGAIGSITLPTLSRLYSAKDGNAYQKVVRYTIVIHSSLAVLLAVPIALLSPWLMAIYGPGFEEHYLVLVLLVVLGIVMAITGILWQLIISLGNMWASFWLTVLGSSFSVAIMWGLRDHGAMGLALATWGLHFTNLVLYGLYGWLVIRPQVRLGQMGAADR